METAAGGLERGAAAALVAELRQILAQVGPGGVWRPVFDHRGRLLAEGCGDPADGLGGELPAGLFAERRVIDLGCNFGAFSFLAARSGAAAVLGVDIDARIVRGCRLLKALYGLDNVAFIAADLRHIDRRQTHQVGMMIDFIGKQTITSGLLPVCLDVLEAVSTEAMLLSLRAVYRIDKHLGGQRRRLAALYPKAVSAGGRFEALAWVRERFRPRWRMRRLPAGGGRAAEHKQTVLFERR